MSQNKKEQLDDFVHRYVVTHQNLENLMSLQTKMSKSNEIGLNLTFEFNGEYISLNDIAGVQNTDVFKSLEEDINLYIQYLIKQIEAKQNNMLSEIEFTKNTPLIEDSNNHSNTDVTNKNEFNLQKYIDDEVLGVSNGEYINPMEIYEKLIVFYPEIELAEIHNVLRLYVDKNKLNIVHYSKCYKCSKGKEKYYNSLPREIVCDECGEDIVNVEIRYQKMEEMIQ